MPYDTSHALPPDQYRREATPKDLIVLHFTAGLSAEAAMAWWKQTPERVATAFIVDLDGQVLQAFDPIYWAPHLGIKGDNNSTDRRSIGIEIVNPGPLRPQDGQLCWWPPAMKFEAPYCAVDEDDRYVKLESPWRGETYFATYPDSQVEAVARLIAHLGSKFRAAIPMTLPPPEKRGEFDLPFFKAWKGIAGHHNFRAQKVDPGPAFPWEALL